MNINEPNRGRSREGSKPGGKAAVGIVGALVVIVALVEKAAVTGGKAALKLGHEVVEVATHVPGGKVAAGARVGALGARAARARGKDDQTPPPPVPSAAP